MKLYIIENWLLKPSQYDLTRITKSLIQQAWARLLFSVACTLYLMLHAELYGTFRLHILIIFSTYLIYNALTLITIRRKPKSLFRLLFGPFFDTFVICYAMMIDGGNASGIFYILFIIIIGNSFRFGNPLMIYTQALTILGLATLSLHLKTQIYIPADYSLLIWQFFALLTIPGYVYLIRKRSEELLSLANEKLEQKVDERTGELTLANTHLSREIKEKAEAIGKMEQAEMKYRHAQKMEAIGTLVGGIAHDFNNMLSGITANLYIIQRQVSDSEPRQRLKKIGDLTMHAAEMIRQLMTFARKDDVALNHFDLTAFFKKAIKLACISIPEHISCQTELPDEPLIIRGDSTQIQQILMNLLNNARDALREVEQPRIRIALRRFTPDTSFLSKHPDAKSVDYAVFKVADNGCGINKEKTEKIFEPFYTTKEVGSGTGLGLAMIYGAVQSHGGCIDVESKQGEGTTFSIYLPLSNETTNIMDSEDRTLTEKGDGETILLVDDDHNLLDANKVLLEKLGYRVHTASDGNQAIAAYKAHQDEIDLVLMDVVMPVLGGVAAAERIRKLDRDAKIILTTGYDKDNELTCELSTQWDQVLNKPLVVEELNRAIRKHLQS